ncbi:MAG: hypothetical protein PUF07_07995 [Bacteroidales bacterium]|nr:hypothetical protein [Bacteroidales bacterium]
MKKFFQRLKKFFQRLEKNFQALEKKFPALASFLKIREALGCAFSFVLKGIPAGRGLLPSNLV